MTRAWGEPVSSAILYLAIVAIWACVLVPRWLRRPHEQSPEQVESYDAGSAESAGAGEFADSDPYAETPDFATLREQDGVASGAPVAWEEPPVPNWADGQVEATYSVTASYSAEVTYSAETADGEAEQESYYDYDAAPDGGYDPSYSGDAQGYSGDVPHRHVDHGSAAEGWQPPVLPASWSGPSPHLVQARRRTLTMVLLITVAVMGSAFIGLTPFWTAIPPFLMLGGYLLLLREAARADVEHAHRWAEAEAFRAARRAELARERARQAEAVTPPEPTAQIITLTTPAAQAEDQLYDQYADAEYRAVGD
jgi:hypothetical protein